MPELCYTLNCNSPAEDEYHWWEEKGSIWGEVEIVWKLCEKCCEFACDVVECVSNLDNEQERKLWTL